MADEDMSTTSLHQEKMKAPGETEPGLTGWAAAEDYVKKHDEGMVQDFVDDVDTLLVFAGLFSAVLTAFVIESYTMLQVDNTDTTVQLLTRISMQMESFTLNQGFLNSTAPPFELPDFQPDNSALWINTPWFLGLVISIAAALFGILAKQWLREYKQWNSALATPRENMLVRQIRFEAWNEWNIAASISSIPALLEFALILFVAGLIVFLWGLNPVVAIVVTVAIAIFLVITSSITLLPAFFKRCPYKSPTAWACVVLWEFIRDLALVALNFVRLHLTSDQKLSIRLSWYIEHWHTPSRNWRERDLQTANVRSFVDTVGKTHDAVDLIDGEICTEWADMGEDGSFGSEKVSVTLMPLVRDRALNAVGQVAFLVKALMWVSLASQDARVQDHVIHCTKSMHASGAIVQSQRTNMSEVLQANGLRSLSLWYLLCRVWEHNDAVHVYGELRSDSQLAESAMTALRQSLRRTYHAFPFVHKTYEDTPEVIRYELDELAIKLKQNSGLFSYTTTEAQIVSHILVSDIRACIDELLVEWFWYKQRLVHGRRVVELLCALYHVLDANSARVDFQPKCIGPLVEAHEAICNSPRKLEFDIDFPGLRTAIVQVACRFGKVSSDDGCLSVSTERQPMASPMEVSDYASLAVAQTTRLPTLEAEDRHMFVWLVDRWMNKLVTGRNAEIYDEGVSAVQVMNRMVTVARRSLRKLIPNCGCYHDLPWIDTMSSGPALVFREIHKEALYDLLDILRESNEAGLITGKARSHLQDLLVRHPREIDTSDTDDRSERGGERNSGESHEARVSRSMSAKGSMEELEEGRPTEES